MSRRQQLNAFSRKLIFAADASICDGSGFCRQELCILLACDASDDGLARKHVCRILICKGLDRVLRFWHSPHHEHYAALHCIQPTVQTTSLGQMTCDDMPPSASKSLFMPQTTHFSSSMF